MDIIILNNVQLKVSLLLNSSGKKQYQQEFVTTIVWKSTIVYHLHRYKSRT